MIFSESLLSCAGRPFPLTIRNVVVIAVIFARAWTKARDLRSVQWAGVSAKLAADSDSMRATSVPERWRIVHSVAIEARVSTRPRQSRRPERCRRTAMPDVTLDHCVIHVSDWDRSNAF